MSKLIPEVQALLKAKKLSEIDADWIKNLPADKQLAAALKYSVDPPNPAIMMPEPRPYFKPTKGLKRSTKPKPTRVLPEE